MVHSNKGDKLYKINRRIKYEKPILLFVCIFGFGENRKYFFLDKSDYLELTH